jgi:aspartate kinase
MPIWVQKFGGTSLSTREARAHAIKHVKYALEKQVQPVVVVSAMGRRGEPYATDTLLDLIAGNGNRLPARETDMLLACGEIVSAVTFCSLLHEQGIASGVLTGGQAGILTDGQHGDARILHVNPARILELLNEGKVVIVAGFQGQTAAGDCTTLGRGGSDTTATALGAALGAEFVDIFTDVEGVLTADPRVVRDAQRIQRIGYHEICNMAYNGAKVIHPRAVEIAMQAQIPLRIRSTFAPVEDEGTLVSHVPGRDPNGSIRDRHVTGIAHAEHLAQIQIPITGNSYELQLKVFKAMAAHGISVDFINVNPSGIMYTVFDRDRPKAMRALEQLGCEARCVSDCSKVAVIGGGINGVPGIMSRIVEALTEENIPILQTADSNTTIWVLVAGKDTVAAVRALHRKFQLHESI